jgi:hypothetical protein
METAPASRIVSAEKVFPDQPEDTISCVDLKSCQIVAVLV